MNFKALSARPSTPHKLAAALFLLFGFIGFADAAYLTAKHYLGGPIPCSVFSGCEKVTTSRYAVLLGIPLSLWGGGYYLAVLLGTVAYFDLRRDRILTAVAAFTAIGFVASAYFVYLQIWVIEAICPFCMLSAATSTALFIVGIFVLRRRSRDL